MGLAFVLSLSCSGVVNGQQCRPVPSDRTFVNPELSFTCIYGGYPACLTGSQFATGSILITRVVGPGLLNDGTNFYTSSGMLRDATKFIQNGVIGRSAFIQVAARSDDEINSHRIEFRLNGGYLDHIDTPIATASSGPARTVVKCVEVDVRRLRFALRNDISGPTPGDNVFTIRGDNRRCEVPDEICFLEAWVESITIEAMAPVVLVHGINSGPEAFDQFEPVLKNAGIPTIRVNLGDGSIEAGAANLLGQVMSATTAFGADRFHVIAHSKGGLWTRRMARNLPIDKGMYSLTTLDTPHNGSVFADVGARIVSGFTLTFAAARSITDLSVASLRAFNAGPLIRSFTTPSLAWSNRVRYAFLAADANLNSDTGPDGLGIIQPSEATYLVPSLNQQMYTFLQRVLEIRIAYGPEGESIPVPIFVAGPWQYNDFVVTEDSSWCAGTTRCAEAIESGQLVLLPSPTAHFKATHGSVVSGEVAEYIQQTLGLALEASLEN